MAARNPVNLLKLIDNCTDPELISNLDILKADLGCSDPETSVFSRLSDQLEAYSDVTSLNLYVKIKLLMEIRQLESNIFKLKTDLSDHLKSSKKFCQNHPLDFKLNLLGNLLSHRSTCKTCTLPHKTAQEVEHTTEHTTKITRISKEVIEREIYPKHMVNFVYNIDKCNVCTVRLTSEKKMECLLCGVKVYEAQFRELKSHLQGKKHSEGVVRHYKNLVAYHTFWQNQSSETRHRELQFKFNGYCLECVFCHKGNLKFEDVSKHMGCTGASVQDPLEKLYPTKTRQALFSNIPLLEIQQNFYPIFQRTRNDQLICLICNITINEEFQTIHLNSPEHVAVNSLDKTQVSLKMYHEIWSALPESKQRWQKYFQRKTSNMKCNFCEISIAYNADYLVKHVSSREHIECTTIKRKRGRNCPSDLGPSELGLSELGPSKLEVQNDTPAVFFVLTDAEKAALNIVEEEPPVKKFKEEPI